MHTIHLENFGFRTDLILEQLNGMSPDLDHWEEKDFSIDRLEITEENKQKYQKDVGKYITISFPDITDKDNFKRVEELLVQELKRLFATLDIANRSVLVAGLGNEKSTPDALGPRVVDQVLVTRHLFALGEVEEGYANVASFQTQVTGVTGIETSDLIQGLIQTTKVDALIVIDALASSSLERVNKTIQITDSGIHPGSGVGNNRKEISKKTLGIPVIAIGVPTIVDAATIVSDTFQYMLKQFSYKIDNMNNPVLKLVDQKNQDYSAHPITLTKETKKEILGILGNLSEEEFHRLIYEVLSPIQSNLMVTPKEVDFVIEKLGLLIGNGINKSLHKHFNPTN